jgi:arabinogalactan oligomer/maltooligosaccharide transport system substrate-binding protein
MMQPLLMAMVRSPGSPYRRRRSRTLLLSLLCGLSLAGCTGRLELPKVLYLSISTNSDQRINAELLDDFVERLNVLQESYRQIHRDTRFQFSIYPDEWIANAIKRRSNAALGPDLLLINGDTARDMLGLGLIDPFPSSPDLEKLFSPDDLARMRGPSGQLAGIPLLIQPQVACFNRKRLAKPPTTLDELLKATATGNSVGLSVELDSMFWTAGSTGAVTSLQRAAAGKALNLAEREKIIQWLRWLQNASNQQRMSFLADQLALKSEFTAGRLDWISCSSSSVPRLRKSLGSALGVASLPSGPGGQASPLNRLRVIALGRSSSREGRERALSFSRFVVNPLIQRTLTIGTETLPANRFVKVPVQSSETLAAMVTSQQGGQQVTRILSEIHDDDPRRLQAQSLITQVVFGEKTPTSAADELIQLLAQKSP